MSGGGCPARRDEARGLAGGGARASSSSVGCDRLTLVNGAVRDPDNDPRTACQARLFASHHRSLSYKRGKGARHLSYGLPEVAQNRKEGGRGRSPLQSALPSKMRNCHECWRTAHEAAFCSHSLALNLWTVGVQTVGFSKVFWRVSAGGQRLSFTRVRSGALAPWP
jgi:hypothetical protein